MKCISFIWLVGLSLMAPAQTSDQNHLIGKVDSVFSEELDAYINIVIYEPETLNPNRQVIPILYIFGDVLFETFAGSINYLHNELELIPSCILIGINENPEKQLLQYQQEYAAFISSGMMEQLSAGYHLTSNGILYGHSRASRLVGKVILEHPRKIDHFILSAPWFTAEHLVEFDKVFSQQSHKISIYYSLSQEDLENPAIQEANEKFTSLLKKHEDVISSKYQYFDNETHMSTPPLSFYYGVKYFLQE